MQKSHGTDQQFKFSDQLILNAILYKLCMVQNIHKVSCNWVDKFKVQVKFHYDKKYRLKKKRVEKYTELIAVQ